MSLFFICSCWLCVNFLFVLFGGFADGSVVRVLTYVWFVCVVY